MSSTGGLTRRSVPTPADLLKREVRLIASKWRRLTADDIATLETADDLIAILTAKYSLETRQARKIIDAAIRAAPR